ncbi:MAG: hypothetical protein MUD01_23330, partial [Chloroflexaceae bacterium]|jgi:hypothetical protein|nr:hypothetical protein [Chloroflexaceae bacterium]
VSIVQVSEAAQVEIASPLVVREETPMKCSFLVGDFAALRAAALATGGGLKPAEAAWRWRGALHLDGWDPEGNVVQFRVAEAQTDS